MKDSIIVGLLQNTAILLAFSLIYEYWWAKDDTPKKFAYKILTGFVIGLTGIVLMLTPWILIPGVVFDTRSVILSVSGLFFGATPTIIAMIITGIFRLTLGGDGVWMGISVITASGLTGILWNTTRPIWKSKHYVAELVAMGVIVHLIMLGCTVFLPYGQRLETLKTLTIPILSIYPLSTILLGSLMFRQYRNWQNRKASERLHVSEEELIKAKEKAEESDKLKSIFSRKYEPRNKDSDECNNGIFDFAGEKGLDESEKLQYLEIIRSSGNRLLQLINDILDLSKLEAKQLTLVSSECILYEIFINTVKSFRKSELLQNKPDLELILNYPAGYEKIKLVSDCNRISQVLDNLISNAIKYTEKGIIETGCSVRTENGMEFIEIYVKDTGPGISEDMNNLVFERFRQIEEGRFHEGAGLGLSISKGIIDLLGGKIWFVSKVNYGSTFYFTIPYITPDKSSEENIVTGEILPQLNGKKIIIAEDDYNSFRYLQLILKSQNAIITHAENGKVLMNMVSESLPDLILLDINMPVMSGLEFLSEMKSRGLYTKIIAQTAYAMPDEREKCLRSGCHGYISKPINKNELLRVINTVLSY